MLYFVVTRLPYLTIKKNVFRKCTNQPFGHCKHFSFYNVHLIQPLALDSIDGTDRLGRSFVPPFRVG